MDNRHYMNRLMHKQGQVDFLTQNQEQNRISELKRERSLEQILDIKNILAGARSKNSVVKQIVLLNHQAPKKVFRSIKAQREVGFFKTQNQFSQLAKEIASEKNFALKKTEWQLNKDSRSGQTRVSYGFYEIDPNFVVKQPIDSSKLSLRQRTDNAIYETNSDDHETEHNYYE